jgi:hypothetical protein
MGYPILQTVEHLVATEAVSLSRKADPEKGKPTNPTYLSDRGWAMNHRCGRAGWGARDHQAVNPERILR